MKYVELIFKMLSNPEQAKKQFETIMLDDPYFFEYVCEEACPVFAYVICNNESLINRKCAEKYKKYMGLLEVNELSSSMIDFYHRVYEKMPHSNLIIQKPRVEYRRQIEKMQSEIDQLKIVCNEKDNQLFEEENVRKDFELKYSNSVEFCNYLINKVNSEIGTAIVVPIEKMQLLCNQILTNPNLLTLKNISDQIIDITYEIIEGVNKIRIVADSGLEASVDLRPLITNSELLKKQTLMEYDLEKHELAIMANNPSVVIPLTCGLYDNVDKTIIHKSKVVAFDGTDERKNVDGKKTAKKHNKKRNNGKKETLKEEKKADKVDSNDENKKSKEVEND
jgi:hypothetical protein